MKSYIRNTWKFCCIYCILTSPTYVLEFNALNKVNGRIKSGNAGTPSNASTRSADVTVGMVRATWHHACRVASRDRPLRMRS